MNKKFTIHTTYPPLKMYFCIHYSIQWG